MFVIVEWFFYLVIFPWWATTGWFFAVAKGAELKATGVEFGWYVKGGIYPFLAIGLVFDFLFNVVWGTAIFREPPRELTFSSRVKRHAKKGRAKGLEWQNRINKIMPGHI